MKLIGVLALQGDYDKHLRTLDQVNIPAIDVRYPSQLSKIDGLIIPGGESTTMNDLMSRIDFHNLITTMGPGGNLEYDESGRRQRSNPGGVRGTPPKDGELRGLSLIHI